MKPAPPAHIAPYVEILGEDLALEVFAALGGSEVYFAATPRRNKLADVVGVALAADLAERMGPHSHRVPLPNRWMALQLKSKGLPVAEIARRLRKTDVTIRRYLSDMPRDDRQLSLGL